MAEPAKNDDTLVVTLTRGELRSLMREAAAEALAHAASPPMQYVDVETAAKHFNVSGQTIRNWIAQGAPAAKPGKDYRVQLAPFTAWVEAHRPGSKLKRVK